MWLLNLLQPLKQSCGAAETVIAVAVILRSKTI